MTLEEIQNMAGGTVTNYEGDERGRMYTGYGDDMVEFAGQASTFASSLASNRIFTFIIKNGENAPKTVLLCPSYIPAIDANTFVVKDGVLNGGGGLLTASGNPATIAEFLAWVNLNPTQIVAMRLQSDNSAQLQTTMNIVRKSPFKKLENDFINIGSYVSEANNNDKLVTVPRPFQMDNQTEVSLTIPAGATTTVTLFCGGVLNTAAALNKKFQKAVAGAASV